MAPQSGKCRDLTGTVRTAFLQALFLAAIGIAVAAAFNAYRQDGLGWSGPGGLPAGHAGEPEAFETITLDDAFIRYEEGALLFVDSRVPSAFLSGHLPGACNVPPEVAQSFLGRLKDASESGKVLVIYCDGPGCDLSSRLASFLARHGLSGIRILEAGWEGWYDEGFPVEEGGGS